MRICVACYSFAANGFLDLIENMGEYRVPRLYEGIINGDVASEIKDSHGGKALYGIDDDS